MSIVIFKTWKYVCLFLLAGVMLFLYIHREYFMTSKKQPIITIFVHGSRPQLPEWIFKMAHYSFLPGLHHVQKQSPEHGPHVIIDGLVESGYIDHDHLYFFGWSGKVSNNERKRTAQELLLPALEQLIQQYKTEHNVTPIINIITHSHGGNVALYLLNALEETQSPITINELILLAVPVQSWTRSFAASDKCNQMYSLYSTDDTLQIVDPQGIQAHTQATEMTDKPDFFALSDRTFGPHEHLTQARILINGRDPWHIGFIDLVYPPTLRKSFPHYFPRFLPELGALLERLREATQNGPNRHFMVHINTGVPAIEERISLERATQEA